MLDFTAWISAGISGGEVRRLIAMPGSEISKVALGLDVRADQNFMDATRILEQLKEKGYKFEILFMDSDDAALIKRYKETRRVHPLAADGRVEDGIHKERKILETIRKNYGLRHRLPPIC